MSGELGSALDAFMAHYYARRPVNATCTGVHDYDAVLPDWSPAGLAALDAEMEALHAALPAFATPSRPDEVDAELARGFLEIQRAEVAGAHGPRGNPALWTGEAIFGLVSLMIRDFAPVAERMRSAASRLAAVPPFLGDARATLGTAAPHPAWTARALRECTGAHVLLTTGLARWIEAHPTVPDGIRRAVVNGADAARAAFSAFAAWLRARPTATDEALACGREMLTLLLTRGHACDTPIATLLGEARAALGAERARLDEVAHATAGSWGHAQAWLAADHPAPDEYLRVFGEVWSACHARAAEHDVVTWPAWPIRYVEFPRWTSEAAPYLYYLFYRSPAPLDRYTTYEYAVPPLPADDAAAHLRAWNRSVVTLNHVVHHGAIGHHVQNWHAYHRAPTRIGRVAAVDCASRIGMFCGGTMAEGWACYATALMEELEFLTPLERVAEQHSKVRFLARAVLDLELHTGAITYDEGVAFWVAQVGASAEAARGEVTKASMFPGTAIMYWLGTREIHALRERRRRALGDGFSLKAFHDELLGHGSIPVALVARLMEAAA